MGNLIRDLRAEHTYMSEVLDLIEAQLDRIEAGEPPDYELLQDAVYFMTEYPDLFHHPRENLVYRRMMQRHRKHRSSVRALEKDHARLGALGLAFREVVEDTVEDVPVERSALLARGREYLDAQRGHIADEETRIFPMVEEVLNDADWRAIDSTVSGAGPVGLREITRSRFRTLHDVLHGEA
ncbi:hemerythrin domain-containing protein [Ectothiorhodospiraceae bacterium WFHF3C12]|nr:hemerythrin domain-containing protein [Ectothiorhodospiraceae bacterium WFHF3C12]